MLGGLGRHITILRMQVGNSTDTRLLGRQYEGKVSVLWINDPTRLLFTLKEVIEAGESLALKCDRLEFSAKTEPFHFLGARRLFPFTIYHLALMFDRPHNAEYRNSRSYRWHDYAPPEDWGPPVAGQVTRVRDWATVVKGIEDIEKEENRGD